MGSPAGLDEAGRKLWRSIDDVFDFAEEPGKVQILAQACRVADVIAEMDDAADELHYPSRGRWDSRSSARSSPKPGCNARRWLNCSAGSACPITTKTTRPASFGLDGPRLAG